MYIYIYIYIYKIYNQEIMNLIKHRLFLTEAVTFAKGVSFDRKKYGWQSAPTCRPHAQNL